MRLEDLKGVSERMRFERILKQLQDPEIKSLPDLSFVRHGKLDGATAHTLTSALYVAGKRLVFSDRLPDALRGFGLARFLGVLCAGACLTGLTYYSAACRLGLASNGE